MYRDKNELYLPHLKVSGDQDFSCLRKIQETPATVPISIILEQRADNVRLEITGLTPCEKNIVLKILKTLKKKHAGVNLEIIEEGPQAITIEARKEI